MKSTPTKSAKTFLFIALLCCLSQNTIRLVYNEAFHKKLFFSASAGVQLGVEEGELEESHA